LLIIIVSFMAIKRKEARLSIRQQRFVRGVMQPSTSPAEAVIQAGYDVKDKGSAQSLAVNMMKSPRIQKAITEVLDELYPNSGNDSIRVLREIINSPAEKTADRIKAIETIAKFQGWNAPTKHQSLSAKLDMSKYQLPMSKKEEK